MSKYQPLWEHVSSQNADFTMTYAEIEAVAGIPIDHSFLTYKKELLPYGWQVGKISMKNRTVQFIKTEVKA